MLSRTKAYRVKVYGKPNKGVVFFFCPFGMRRWQFLLPHLPISSLVKVGFQVVCYDYNIIKVTATPKSSKRILDEVLQDVQQRVNIYKKNGVENISSFGASLGSLFASYCSAKIPEIRKVVLNVPYGDMVGHILSAPRMLLLPKHRVQRYITLGGGEKQLRKFFAGYSPLDNISELKKKKILLYLSKKDRVLLYSNSSKLKKELESAGNLHYIENTKLGHFWTATYNHVKSSVYINFIQS